MFERPFYKKCVCGYAGMEPEEAEGLWVIRCSDPACPEYKEGKSKEAVTKEWNCNYKEKR